MALGQKTPHAWQGSQLPGHHHWSWWPPMRLGRNYRVFLQGHWCSGHCSSCSFHNLASWSYHFHMYPGCWQVQHSMPHSLRSLAPCLRRDPPADPCLRFAQNACVQRAVCYWKTKSVRLFLGATIGCSNGPAPADPPSLPGCKSTASRELCLKGKLVRKSVQVRARVSGSSAFTRAQAHF